MKINRRKPWNKDELQAEAIKYKTRSEFSNRSASAYNSAWSKGILDELCAHMEISNLYSTKKWNKDEVELEALRYKSKSEFKKKCSGGYGYALSNGFLEMFCTHMLHKSNKVNFVIALKEAMKYKKKSEFKSGSYRIYKYALKNNILDSICGHMKLKINWDKASVIETASNFKTMPEFRNSFSGAYKYALNYGFIEEIQGLMEKSEYGFDKNKPSIVYFIELQGDFGRVCKIGITNRTTRKRISGLGVGKNVVSRVIKEINFDTGFEARNAEKAYHKLFDGFKYHGEYLFSNGNTELFLENIIEIVEREE